MKTGYLAPEGLEESLERELKNVVERHGRLFVAEGEPQEVRWAQNIWYDLQTIRFDSISEAAAKLRAMGGLWSSFPTAYAKRAEWIASRLPYFSPKPLSFLSPLPSGPLGSWMLVDKQTLLASRRCSSPLMHGEFHFQETKFPPSRAYLKLWELFTRTGIYPQKKERCLELGASPGSWTWVLQQLGAEVIAVDRAELAPEIETLPGVTFFKRDAFSIRPTDFAGIDWIFSDVICYPEKLLEWLQPWLETDVKMVCTLKFQGSDYRIVDAFRKIPNSQIFRLFHNKHELTWVRFSSS